MKEVKIPECSLLGLAIPILKGMAIAMKRRSCCIFIAAQMGNLHWNHALPFIPKTEQMLGKIIKYGKSLLFYHFNKKDVKPIIILFFRVKYGLTLPMYLILKYMYMIWTRFYQLSLARYVINRCLINFSGICAKWS